ncbi:MAG: hypothetical protein MJZ32_02575 [Bacteroidaceae bacterium]|nr:hypothetical protein [Bacteroidaceae bacterium]
MKKFFTIFSLLFMLFALNASADVNIYLKSTNVQAGAKGKIDLCLETENPIGTVNVEFTLPEGVKVVGNPVSEGAYVTFNPAINNLLLGKGDPYYSTGVVATINVEVDADAEIGEHPMTITMAKIVEPNLTTYDFSDVESTLAIQKTAVIEPQRDDYTFEAIPTCVATDATSMSLPVNFANEGYVENISFNIEYPAGMLTTKSGKNYNLTVNKDRFDTGSDATLTVKATSGTAVAFTNAESDLVKPGDGNLLTIPVTLTNVADGVYTIKFTDIKVSVTNDEADPISTETLPDYYVSVIVGQPSTQEAILYGHYDEATAEAFSTAMKNVAVANITAAEMGEGAMSKFQDVITVDDNKKWVYYYRKSDNYATTVMPYDLGASMYSEGIYQLFRIEDMTSESIIIKELSQGECIPANTPCIFKGILAFLKENMPLSFGAIDNQSIGMTTFKGTYEATSIAEGEGYYIASNGKFYNDGASIRPFRGYFEGNVSGVKSLRVLLDDATGLIDITDQFSKEDIYNLQGIRMNNVQKGINIKGGKKVLVK